MTIDWIHFTPLTSLAGGILIGLSAALLVLANGHVAGISGILGELLHMRKGDIGWRVAFLLGLFIAPAAFATFLPYPAATIDANEGMLLAGGLLVGIGTRYAGGCTSGHGVCGLSRLSLRSLVATLCFMGSGIAIVFVMRHLLA
jgi:uncharacterized membrane protein YedE/YeeE